MSYELARHIYESFLGENDCLTPKELTDTPVGVLPNWGPNRTTRLYADGEMGRVRVGQSLSRGSNRRFYLTTAGRWPDNSTETTVISTNTDGAADMAKVETLTASLFMKSLVEISLHRPEQEEPPAPDKLPFP